MKITLNKKWRIGGWTSLLQGLGGAAAEGASGAAGGAAGAAASGLASGATGATASTGLSSMLGAGATEGMAGALGGGTGALGGAGMASGAASGSSAAASAVGPGFWGKLGDLIKDPKFGKMLFDLNQQGGGNAFPPQQGQGTDWTKLLGMM